MSGSSSITRTFPCLVIQRPFIHRHGPVPNRVAPVYEQKVNVQNLRYLRLPLSQVTMVFSFLERECSPPLLLGRDCPGGIAVGDLSVIWYIVVRPKRPKMVCGKDCHLTQAR